MVVTSAPATRASGVMQERVGRPPTCTVQAPHIADAAAELRAGQADVVADDPQQRSVVLDVDRHGAAIDVKRGHVRSPAVAHWMRVLLADCRDLFLEVRPGRKLVRVRRR